MTFIEVLVSPAPLKIQSENVVLHKINKIINTLDFSAADKIMTNITNNANLLQTQDYAIQAQDIHAYNKSLMIAEVENFETYYNGRKTKAKFEFKGKTYTNFSVTDYDYFTKITRHNKCKLILSIPESEWNGAHFKFIAKVFYSEKNSQNTLNDYAKQQLSVLKIALQTQDETLIKYQLSKLKAASELSELCSLVEMGANAQALMLIDGFLTDNKEWFYRLIAWADENKISADKFPRDKKLLLNLKGLDLSNCGLKTLPDEFANLQNLEKLNLTENEFQEFPKVICKLKNLKEFDLWGFSLKTLPDEFANLQKLKKLNMPNPPYGYSDSSQRFPNAICKLVNLEELDLTGCFLKYLPDEFVNLKKLEKLYLGDGYDSSNYFREFPSVICELKNLKELDLWNCDLKSLPNKFANLQSLERLNLSYNQFQEFPKVICKLKNLKELDLWNCHLKSLPDEFANLQKLEKLKLSGNKFQEFPKVIYKLKNLKECDKKKTDCFNKIKEIDVDDFDDTELPF